MRANSSTRQMMLRIGACIVASSLAASLVIAARADEEKADDGDEVLSAAPRGVDQRVWSLIVAGGATASLQMRLGNADMVLDDALGRHQLNCTGTHRLSSSSLLRPLAEAANELEAAARRYSCNYSATVKQSPALRHIVISRRKSLRPIDAF